MKKALITFLNKYLVLSLVFIVASFVLAKFLPGLLDNTKKEVMVVTSDDVDRKFLNEMIEHHMGAVSMAREALEKSERKEVKDLAQLIISDQEKEIDQMYKWKLEWFEDSSHVNMQMGGHSKSMVVDLGKKDKNFDLRFLDGMIEHHLGAIQMAEKVMVPTDRKEIHDFAKRIIEAQSKEIDMMKTWRRDWYGK